MTLAHGTDAEGIPSWRPLLRLLAVCRNPFPRQWFLLNSASVGLFRAGFRGFWASGGGEDEPVRIPFYSKLLFELNHLRKVRV